MSNIDTKLSPAEFLAELKSQTTSEMTENEDFESPDDLELDFSDLDIPDVAEADNDGEPKESQSTGMLPEESSDEPEADDSKRTNMKPTTLIRKKAEFLSVPRRFPRLSKTTRNSAICSTALKTCWAART